MEVEKTAKAIFKWGCIGMSIAAVLVLGIFGVLAYIIWNIIF